MPAIPRLIQALDDDNFIRSIHYARSFFYSHSLLRIRDAAELIIVRIAGRSFDTLNKTPEPHDVVEYYAQVKANVSSWYDSYVSKGEHATLFEGVARGDDNSSSRASLLVKKYPDKALPAIITGVQHASNSVTASGLVGSAGALKSPDATQFLYDQLVHSKFRSARISAAFCLSARSDSRARVYDLGLSALPGVMARLKSISPSSPDRPILRSLGQEVACTVRTVDIDPQLNKLSPSAY